VNQDLSIKVLKATDFGADFGVCPLPAPFLKKKLSVPPGFLVLEGMDI